MSRWTRKDQTEKDFIAKNAKSAREEVEGLQSLSLFNWQSVIANLIHSFLGRAAEVVFSRSVSILAPNTWDTYFFFAPSAFFAVKSFLLYACSRRLSVSHFTIF
jgi:hypothetical protein